MPEREGVSPEPTEAVGQSPAINRPETFLETAGAGLAQTAREIGPAIRTGINTAREQITPGGRQQARAATQERLTAQLSNYDQHQQLLQEELAQTTDQHEQAALQQQLDQIAQERLNVTGEYARDIMERLSAGERIDEEQMLFLATDVINRAEQSALAELVLIRNGFKTMQEALGKLGVESVRAEDIVVQLDKDHKHPWLKEHFAKFVVSGGISVAALAVIGVLGGPIGWAGLAGGLAGGALGRLGGEWLRYRALGKERRQTDKEGNEINRGRIGEAVATNLLGLIAELRNHAADVEAAGSDQDARADALSKLLTAAASKEVARVDEYQKLDKRFAWVKAGLGMVGAVGGSVAGSFWQAGAEKAQMLAEAKEKGIHLWHDANGHAHITPDYGQGHHVKEMVDGTWHYQIEQSDVAEATKKLGENFGPSYHYYLTDSLKESLTEGGFDVEFLTQVPSELNGAVLHHAGQISEASITSAIDEAIRQKILLVTAAVSGGTALTEVGGIGLKYRQLSAERLRKENKPLIDLLEAHAFALERGHGPVVTPEEPEQVKARLERLARSRGVELPETPANGPENWYKQPQLIKEAFTLHKLPLWPQLDESGQLRQQDGQLFYDGVGRVDPEKNEIVIIYKTTSGDYAWRVDQLDTFLLTHAEPRVQVGEKRPATTAAQRESTTLQTETRANSVEDWQAAVAAEIGEAVLADGDISPELRQTRVGKPEVGAIQEVLDGYLQDWQAFTPEQQQATGITVGAVERDGRQGRRITITEGGREAYLELMPTRDGRNTHLTLKELDGQRHTGQDQQAMAQAIEFMRAFRDRLAVEVPQPQPAPADRAPTPPEPEPPPPQRVENRQAIISNEDLQSHNAFRFSPDAEGDPFYNEIREAGFIDAEGRVRYKDVTASSIRLIAPDGTERTRTLPRLRGLIGSVETIE